MQVLDIADVQSPAREMLVAGAARLTPGCYPQRIDHSQRSAWLGPPIPLNLDVLTEVLKEVPSQYTSLGNSKSGTCHSAVG